MRLPVVRLDLFHLSPSLLIKTHGSRPRTTLLLAKLGNYSAVYMSQLQLVMIPSVHMIKSPEKCVLIVNVCVQHRWFNTREMV